MPEIQNAKTSRLTHSGSGFRCIDVCCVFHNPEKISTNARVRNGACVLSMQSAQLRSGIGIAVRVGLEIHFASERGSVAEIEKETQESYEDTDDQFALLWVAVPICALIISTAAFYFASPVLLPLAIASILSVVFSGVASRLEPYCGRFISAAIVVLLVIGFIAALGYFLTIQLTGSRRPGLRVFGQYWQQNSGAGEEHAAMAPACQGSGDRRSASSGKRESRAPQGARQ